MDPSKGIESLSAVRVDLESRLTGETEFRGAQEHAAAFFKLGPRSATLWVCA
jgi:hypothetical protein